MDGEDVDTLTIDRAELTTLIRSLECYRRRLVARPLPESGRLRDREAARAAKLLARLNSRARSW